MAAPRDYPLSMWPSDDSRFTFGLLLRVAEALAEAGYPPVREGADLIELGQSLFRFLYESEA